MRLTGASREVVSVAGNCRYWVLACKRQIGQSHRIGNVDALDGEGAMVIGVERDGQRFSAFRSGFKVIPFAIESGDLSHHRYRDARALRPASDRRPHFVA